jgi:hypothetical protein
MSKPTVYYFAERPSPIVIHETFSYRIHQDILGDVLRRIAIAKYPIVVSPLPPHPSPETAEPKVDPILKRRDYARDVPIWRYGEDQQMNVIRHDAVGW